MRYSKAGPFLRVGAAGLLLGFGTLALRSQQPSILRSKKAALEVTAAADPPADSTSTSTAAVSSTTTTNTATTTTTAGVPTSSTPSTSTTASVATSTTAVPSTTTTQYAFNGQTLRQIADARGFIIGAAVNGYSLSDPAFAAALSQHFNSITPENAMKFAVIRPDEDTWDFDEADLLVSFALQHGMKVRGTALIWGQDYADGVPAWLRQITDPALFRAAVADLINTEVGRYAGQVDRWDVVNEPFEYTNGELNADVFLTRLGPSYIDWAFNTAHAADPSAELWLNEGVTEYVPEKANALVELIAGLKQRGVPIHGVGLQTHLFIGDTVPDTLGSLARRLRALGVKVAITEMDVPVGDQRSAATQADLFGRFTTELLQVGGSELTTWGVSDNLSWLDSDYLRQINYLVNNWPIPANGLLLDSAFAPKSAYGAVAAALLANPDPLPTTTTSSDPTSTTSGNPTTTVAVGAGSCSSTDYEWLGYESVSSSRPAFVSDVTLPISPPGTLQTVTAVSVQTYDSVTPGTVPSRATINEGFEQIGIRIGAVDVNSLSGDLPDTVAEGAVNENYSGLLTYALPGWAGVTIDGGKIAIRHASRYVATDSAANSVSAHRVLVTVQACTGQPIATPRQQVQQLPLRRRRRCG